MDQELFQSSNKAAIFRRIEKRDRVIYLSDLFGNRDI